MRVFHRRLEPTEEGAKQELHFSFDAEIDGEAQIFWECVDMTLPDVLEQPANLKKLGLDLQRKKGDAKPKWFRFKKGLGQSWHGAPIRSSKAGSASMGREVKVDGGHGLVVYPLVVRLRGIVAGQGEQSEVRTPPHTHLDFARSLPETVAAFSADDVCGAAQVGSGQHRPAMQEPEGAVRRADIRDAGGLRRDGR